MPRLFAFAAILAFGAAAFNATSDPVRGSLYKGPGHLADSTVLLGSPQAAAPDWIQGMGAGTVQLGTQISGNGDMAFWAGRVSDGVDPTRLMAVGTYVGSGTATRTIPLALSGQTPTLVLGAPATTATRVYRADGDTTGRTVVNGATVTNSVTALGPDQITVGTALNATGVTYDVWAITAGALAPVQ